MIVLDTNVISELARPNPDPKVLEWASALAEEDAYITATTLSELVDGVMRLPEGRRRNELDDRIGRAIAPFFDRTLSFGPNVAVAFGRFLADRDAAARNRMSRADAEIAACCLYNNASLATRNVKDFADLPWLDVINPWVAG